MDLADSDAVAGIFAESDATGLPRAVGVTRRTLFRFNGLYFHLVESEEDITPRLYRERSGPLYQDVSTKLEKYMTPYDPNWQEPKDAMADPFYTWSAE
jgi:hypothetical protein